MGGVGGGGGSGGGLIRRQFTVTKATVASKVTGSNPDGRSGKLFLSSDHHGVKTFFSFLTRRLLSQ